jgi:hypothetical protein
MPVETSLHEPPPPSLAPVVITTSENLTKSLATKTLPNRFVPVGEHELDPVATDTAKPGMVSWQTWALAGALLSIGTIVWWFLQPPSADSYYNRIHDRMSDESAASLPQKPSEIDEVRKVITKFVFYYSSDPRAAEVRRWDSQLDLRLQQYYFEQRTSEKSTAKLLPVEQIYLTALSNVRLNPTEALTQLQALVDLYGRQEKKNDSTTRCLQLARLKIEQLEKDVAKLSKEQLDMLKERLNAADALRTRDPEEARKVYRSVVALFADKPWAAELVARANKSLQEITPPNGGKSSDCPPKTRDLK